MKLQILVPHYKEKFEIIKPLLDSINIQQNVDFNEIGVIIVNDGSEGAFSENEIKSFENYKYKIDYSIADHKGVSATRNACLDKATADYVMFCDCDDMFGTMFGLWIIMNEIKIGFDSFVSVFYEESIHPVNKEHFYITRGDINNGGVDSTFVHGKVHRRQYLIDNNIRWNDSLTIHEDSYFNCLCQSLSKNVKYCPTPFYLWKWVDTSVCRHDPKYILKTYNNMLDSNTALVKEFIKRNMPDKAQFYSNAMVYDAYYTMNKTEWLNQENQEYRNATEKRFKEYYLEFEQTIIAIPEQVKNSLIAGIRSRMFGEGLILESVTFADWIKHILEL